MRMGNKDKWINKLWIILSLLIEIIQYLISLILWFNYKSFDIDWYITKCYMIYFLNYIIYNYFIIKFNINLRLT